MGRTTLHLLGTFALAAPDGGMRVGRKAQAMLACAALQGTQGVARPRLMALLWPDLGDEDARTALRQCLHLLRRALGPAAESLDSAGDRLVLHEDAWDIDLLRFQSLATRDDLPSMLEAAAIYRGDLLESLDVGDEFGRWVMAERERLRDMAQALLTRLADCASSPEARETTVALARRLLAGDPVHEGCYRALMRMHARSGLLAKAQATWNECRDVLQRELGVEPSRHTAALMAELRGEAPPARAAAVSDDKQMIQDLMLRGYQYLMLATAPDNSRARDTFQTAADLAPDHAGAMAMVGFTHWLDSISGRTADPARSWQMAEQAAHRALACDPNEATVHTLYGKLHLWSFQYDSALAHMARALALAPEHPWVHFHRGDACSWCGLCEEALVSIERAMSMVTNDAGVFLTIRAWAHWIQRDYRLARVAATSASTRNPTYVWPHGILAAVHSECGDLDAARREAGLARALNPRLSLDFARHVGPLRDPEHRRRWVEAWRAAGMPEHEADRGLPAAALDEVQAIKTRKR